MIVIPDGVEEYFKSVELFARNNNCKESFDKQLMYLDQFGSGSWADRHATECWLWKDSAPFSFFFELRRSGDEGPFITGGLVFHPGATGVDESMSIELTGSDAPHWSVHT